MRYCLAILATGLAAAAASVALSSPPPQPSVASLSWQLDFTHEAPRSISLRLPGREETKSYWYSLFTVTNRTGADQIFVPDFVLYTDTGKIVRAGDGVPGAVFEAIQKRHNNPLLVDLAAATGKILQGEDNAVDSVAIWREFDPKARAFDLFVGGLSGEHLRVPLPVPIKVTVANEKGNKVQVLKTEVVLYKCLHVSYRLPGEAAARSRTAPEAVKRRWVMR